GRQWWGWAAGRSCSGLREEDTEPVLRVGPHLSLGKAGLLQQQAEAGRRVLVRVLGDDVLAALELAYRRGTEPDRMGPPGSQAHLDAAVARVVDSAVAERGGVEIGIEQPVGHRQHIQIERCGDALG